MRESKYTKAVLGPLVRRSRSVAEVIRSLGLQPTGGNHRYILGRIRVLGLDTSHFRGAAWAKGETCETHEALARESARRRRPDGEVFVMRSSEMNGRRLRRRLARIGWPQRCAGCGLTEWQGQPIVLQLDHINGVHNDNRLDNLRLLCPNCHSQTDTYCGRNQGAAKAR